MPPTSSSLNAPQGPISEMPLVLPLAASTASDSMESKIAPNSSAVQQVPILHVINGQHYSGAERVQDLLALQLPAHGFQVEFACLKPDQFSEMRQATDAELVELPMRFRFDLRIVNELVELIRDQGHKLVHAHTPRTALVGQLAARKAGVPFVYHVHSPAGRDSTRRLFNWVNRLIEKQSLRNAVRLITVSPSLKHYMEEQGFAAKQVTCVPNGVPCATESTPRQPPSNGRWTLGTVALFRPRKGTEVLLEALASLRSQGVDVRLRAVGGFETPEYESAILCLAERLGLGESIDWVGFTRNVHAEMGKMDLFVLPSLFGEGLPMVVLEAMTAGLPVVASRVEGLPEAVQHRETGLLVEPASVSQLTQAIEEFVSGQINYTSFSKAARERHAAHFSDKTMAAGVAQVYREVLKGWVEAV